MADGQTDQSGSRQERRERKRRKKHERVPKHGKGLAASYRDAILKRLKRQK